MTQKSTSALIKTIDFINAYDTVTKAELFALAKEYFLKVHKIPEDKIFEAIYRFSIKMKKLNKK